MATDGAVLDGPTWTRLTGQIDWYDRNAKKNQQWFKIIKLVQILLSALVPVVAVADGSRVILGALGAGVVVLEAVQQLYQFHRNWISYRSTCEGLKREQHLFLVGGGEYADAADRTVLLAERLEQLISRETGDWASLETAAQKKPG
jgi:hypothetical protein